MAADKGSVTLVSFPANTASDAFHEHDEGDAIFVGELFNEASHAALESIMLGVNYTAFDGEVLSANRHVPAIDLAEAHDVAGCGVRKAVTVGVEALMDGNGADF